MSMKLPRSMTIAVVLAVVTYGCRSPTESQPVNSYIPFAEQTMKLTSTAFENDSTIDAKYTVEGEDISPPLAWSGAPTDTVSFALICDDPDAPSRERPAAKPWVHWILFNIPTDVLELPAGIPRQGELSQVVGARQGVNSWPSGNIGYRGPAPPQGSGPHRYFFRLYALDTKLKLDAGATKEQLLAAISGHVLAEGELMGTYER